MSTTKKDVITVKKTLSAVAVAGLAFGLGATALSASAATLPTWSPAAPEFAYVGDAFVHDGAAMTDDRTPTFVVDAANEAQVGSTLTVRYSGGGGVLCTSEKPLAMQGSVVSAECTSRLRLPLGKTVVEAFLTSAGGESTSEAVRADVFIAPQNPTIAIAGYDAATDTVTVAGTSMPGGTIRVGQAVESDGGYDEIDVLPNGRWVAQIENPRDRSGIESALVLGGSSWFASTYFDKSAPLKPSVSATLTEGRVEVDVSSTDSDKVVIKNFDWNVVAEVPTTGDSTHVTIAAPVGRAEYFVQAVRERVESAPASFTVNSGAGSPAASAPNAKVKYVSGTRAVLSILAAPGAVVTVTDEGGSIVALKRVGSSPDIEMVVPAPKSKSSAKYVVKQSRDGATSDHDDFTVLAP